MEFHWVLLAVIVIALAFDYVNGFHDAANAIATVVSTRALSPRQAVLLAATLNFVGAFTFTNVAKTISSGLVHPDSVNDQALILAALLGAITWNLLTWYWGLPSSSSHALVGGLVGVAMAKMGMDGVLWWGVMSHVVLPGLLSPVIGLVLGYIIMVSMYWALRNARPTVNAKFKKCQMFSASLMAFAHGTNDAQKVMGIITMALITAGVQTDHEVHPWVKFACATAIALGTSAGGWRIIKTIGVKVVKLQPVNGFAAETTASSVLITTAALGMPISTTHVITAAIMGVGATKRLSAVRWGVAGSILWAWTFTIPASAAMSALCYYALRLLDPSL